jgi:hydroxymethylpyrimidine/phosphomethylpyrimidine kinase
MKFDPEYCSAMNIRYSRGTVAQLRSKGFLIGQFDRRLEPKKVKEQEGSSLEWGVGEVLRKMKRVPDFIYDEGDVGREPMIRVLGRNPMEVIQKVLQIADFRFEIGKRQRNRNNSNL